MPQKTGPTPVIVYSNAPRIGGSEAGESSYSPLPLKSES